MTKVEFFVIVSLILGLVLCFISYVFNIEYEPEDIPTLEKIEIIMLQEYDDVLDNIGFEYQNCTDSYYLGWAINDDHGLHFIFKNKNGNIYCIPKKIVVNYILEMSEEE